MGRIYQRGRLWWLQYYANGALIRESSGSTLKTEATSLLKLREGEVRQGRLPSLRAQKTTFEEVAALYIQDYEINGRKSSRRARGLVGQLRKMFGPFRACRITSEHIRDYIFRRQSEGVANGTINRELGALKRMFHLASQQTPPLVTSRPHVPHLQENNVRKGFFTDEEYKVLRGALPDHVKVPLVLAYWTGMRAGEIVMLQWDQLDLERGELRLEPDMTKNGQGRTIPLVSEVVEVLWQWKQLTLHRYASCRWVCHYRGKRMTRIPKRTWRTVCDRVGLGGKIFHDLRRTAVRNMVRAGVPERVAMVISGHKTRSVFDRYDIVSERDMFVAREKLTNFLKKEVVQVPDHHFAEAGTVG
jgi:integrase